MNLDRRANGFPSYELIYSEVDATSVVSVEEMTPAPGVFGRQRKDLTAEACWVYRIRHLVSVGYLLGFFYLFNTQEVEDVFLNLKDFSISVSFPAGAPFLSEIGEQVEVES